MSQVGVIDVGSNTLRLLVASVSGRSVTAVVERKAWLRLGADVAFDESISTAKLAEAAAVVAEFAREARQLGCRRFQVLIASPGRQARNRDELVRVLAASSASAVRILRAEEEAQLAFLGATTSIRARRLTVVVDAGGGSTQFAVGVPAAGAHWDCSVDIGSLRLASRAFDSDPPGKAGLRKARKLFAEQFDAYEIPLAQRALAVGGSARALRRLLGTPKLSASQLASAGRLLRRCSADELVATYGFARERAATLAAGAAILSEIQKRLGVPLVVAPGGVREGAALVLGAERAAA